MPRRKPTLRNLVDNPDPLFMLIQPIFNKVEISIVTTLGEALEYVGEKIAEDPEVGEVDLRKLDVGFEAFPEKVINAFLNYLRKGIEDLTEEQAHALTRMIVESLLRFAQITVFMKWKSKRKKPTNEEFQEFIKTHPSFRGLERQILETHMHQKMRYSFSIN